MKKGITSYFGYHQPMEENIKATGDVPVAFDNLSHMESVKNRKRMRLIGIEPTHAAPEATALSTELQMHLQQYKQFIKKNQVFFLFFC